MKRFIWLFLFFCFTFAAVSQKFNEKFPQGSYSGVLEEDAGIPVECKIDGQQVHFFMKYGAEAGIEDRYVNRFSKKYRISGDTLFFEGYDNMTPYSAYYIPDDVADEVTDGIRVCIYRSWMFDSYHVSIHSPGKKNIRKEKRDTIPVHLNDSSYVNLNIQAEAGDTIYLKTSLGEYGYLVPPGVHGFLFIPELPEFRYYYACKGESANELILHKGVSDDIQLFYMGDVTEKDLEEIKQMPDFPDSVVCLEACVVNEPDYDIYPGYHTPENRDTVMYTYSYKEALEIAREKNLFIRVFYAAKPECYEQYVRKVNNYNRDAYYNYYDDTFHQLKSFVLLFAGPKNEAQMKRLEINGNKADFILSADEHLLYRKELFCAKDVYDVSFFSYNTQSPVTELRFIYLNKVVEPMLRKNPDNMDALDTYLYMINDMVQSIDYYSYNNAWETFVNSRLYYFENISEEQIPSSETLFSYLDRYVQARFDGNADTSLIRMIVSFYHVVYNYRGSSLDKLYPLRYLIKHAGQADKLGLSCYTSETPCEIAYKLLTTPLYNLNTYAQPEIMEQYRQLIDLFPEYEDYFYLHSYKALDLNSVSPDFYQDLMAFYKTYLTRIMSCADWDDYMKKLKDDLLKFEENDYSSSSIRSPETLYKMLVKLAWLAVVHEGADSDNGQQLLYLAGVAGKQSMKPDDRSYVTADYASLLYYVGRKEQAITVMKQYCADGRAESYLDYDREMMYILKEMVMDIYKPRQMIEN